MVQKVGEDKADPVALTGSIPVSESRDFSERIYVLLKARFENINRVRMCSLHANANGLCYRPGFVFISLLLAIAGVLLCLHVHILPLISFICLDYFFLY